MITELYDRILAHYGYNEYWISIAGSWLVSTLSFWILAGLYLVIDLTGWPSWYLKYRIQESPYPVAWRDAWKVIKQVCINQLFVGIPVAFLTHYIRVWRGNPWLANDLPSAWRWFAEIWILTIFEEAGFYYTHRMFHIPWLYKRFHKIHHEWQAPIAAVALYSHPFEYLISDMLPGIIGPVVMGSHLLTTWTWWMFALFATVITHSGLHIPWCTCPEFHDYHHRNFTECYGVIGLFDHLHGTDKGFKASPAHKRYWKPIWDYFKDPTFVQERLERKQRVLHNQSSDSKEEKYWEDREVKRKLILHSCDPNEKSQ